MSCWGCKVLGIYLRFQRGLLYMGLGFKEFGVYDLGIRHAAVCVYEHQNIQGAFLGF